jgi:hypothetical protein
LRGGEIGKDGIGGRNIRLDAPSDDGKASDDGLELAVAFVVEFGCADDEGFEPGAAGR